jgi:hypothetical protein
MVVRVDFGEVRGRSVDGAEDRLEEWREKNIDGGGQGADGPAFAAPLPT